MTPTAADLLNHLGCAAVAGSRPSVAGLTRLHRRFVEVVPYENLDIVLGQPPAIDVGTSIGRILAGRGGYCYHLNGAFGWLLETLGYRVNRHVGGVQGPHGAAHVNGNHVALTVQVEGGGWLVDVGLSDCLHEPIPLVVGVYRQGPFHYRLERSRVAPGGWRLQHDPRGSFLAMDFAPEPAELADFAAMHGYLSTSPDSPFVRTLCVARRHRAGADVLRSLTLTSSGDTVTRQVLQRRPQWFAALRDVFGLATQLWSPQQCDRLWALAVTQHEAFLAARAARGSGAAAPDG